LEVKKANRGLEEMEEEEDEETTRLIADGFFFDPKIKGINALLRYAEFFHKTLDEIWTQIPDNLRYFLELADILEAKAWKNNSVISRRLLFSESALLIEKVVLLITNKAVVRDACNFRLAIHYVNGCGLDVTEPDSSDSSDFQASEYIYQSRPSSGRSPFSQCLLGLLASVGRSNATAANNSLATADATAVLARLTSATNYGFMPAIFWKAKLLYEGWCDNGGGRIESLKESQRLFEYCEDANFLAEEAKVCKDVVVGIITLSKSFPSAQDPYILISIYGFYVQLKKAVIDAFPTVLRPLIARYVEDHVVAGKRLASVPVQATNRSDWLVELREKVLRFEASEVVSGSKEKSGMSPDFAPRWLSQTFNANFIPEGADESAIARWTVVQTTELWQSMKTAAEAAVAVCDEVQFTEGVNLLTAVATRLTTKLCSYRSM
jgi:hypothetical protein